MAMEPPPFQEAARCDVCKCSFSTFRRRHHCRCCGRTLCHEHSSSQMALPQFGLNTPVRVCADCFNNSAVSTWGSSDASTGGVDSLADGVSQLNIGEEEAPTINANSQHHPVADASECKCGMPLCICEPPAPSKDAKAAAVAPPEFNPKPKRPDPAVRNRNSSSNSNSSSVFNPGQASHARADKPQMDYEVNGEGLREAIKNGDTAGVKKLLSEGVDANYRDKQGMSLLHLAALFNRTNIAFILMEHGASINYKNAQGETPLDCAPATLQYKMRQKMEEARNPEPPQSI